MKLTTLFITFVALSSCGFNKDLTSVISDIEATPKCDTDNVLLHPRDTKKTLSGKVIILNSKLDGCDDAKFTTDKKLESYKKL